MNKWRLRMFFLLKQYQNKFIYKVLLALYYKLLMFCIIHLCRLFKLQPNRFFIHSYTRLTIFLSEYSRSFTYVLLKKPSTHFTMFCNTILPLMIVLLTVFLISWHLLNYKEKTLNNFNRIIYFLHWQQKIFCDLIT